jgi:hypothetical protein
MKRRLRPWLRKSIIPADSADYHDSAPLFSDSPADIVRRPSGKARQEVCRFGGTAFSFLQSLPSDRNVLFSSAPLSIFFIYEYIKPQRGFVKDFYYAEAEEIHDKYLIPCTAAACRAVFSFLGLKSGHCRKFHGTAIMGL